MQPRTTEQQHLFFRVADPVADKAALLRLRDLVYVRDQGRLGDVDDMAGTFDRFDSRAVYLLAEERSGSVAEPVGTVKIVEDSPLGLPCEDMVDLAGFRPGKRLAEFGHLMTIPQIRNRNVGMRLMREALMHSVTRLGATHVLGDFFAEADGSLRGFYTDLGFVGLGEPYQDARFKDAPLSVVGALDLEQAAARCRDGAGSAQQQALLRYFFHDYDHLVRQREHPGELPATRTRRQ